MDALTNAVKLTATDKIRTRNGISTISCGIPRCDNSATYTYFTNRAPAYRRCGSHNSVMISTSGFAKANHAAIVVDQKEAVR